LSKLLVKTRCRLFRNYAGVVVEVTRRLWRNHFRGVCTDREQYKCEHHCRGAHAARVLVLAARQNSLLRVQSSRKRAAFASTRAACASQNVRAHARFMASLRAPEQAR